jgi:hypothetical protein
VRYIGLPVPAGRAMSPLELEAGALANSECGKSTQQAHSICGYWKAHHFWIVAEFALGSLPLNELSAPRLGFLT